MPGRRPRSAVLEHLCRRRYRPGVGQRPLDHPGREVEEGGDDDRGTNGTHRCGAAAEVAHPEALQAEARLSLDHLGGEVRDGVDGSVVRQIWRTSAGSISLILDQRIGAGQLPALRRSGGLDRSPAATRR